jgi:hypothetical protein
VTKQTFAQVTKQTLALLPSRPFSQVMRHESEGDRSDVPTGDQAEFSTHSKNSIVPLKSDKAILSTVIFSVRFSSKISATALVGSKEKTCETSDLDSIHFEK